MLQQNIHPSPVQSFEEMLVKQSLAGNEEAFTLLVHRYEARLLGYIRTCLGHTGDTEQAYDVLQHVLLQFYRSLPMLSARSSLKPWLFQVAHNRCMDELRRGKQRIILFSELDNESSDEELSLLILIHDPRP